MLFILRQCLQLRVVPNKPKNEAHTHTHTHKHKPKTRSKEAVLSLKECIWTGERHISLLNNLTI